MQNQCPRYHPGYEPHALVKFREVMPTTPKVIGAHMWNFKLNFKCSPLKFFGGPPTWFVVCASKPWPVSSACKNLSGRNIFFRKSPVGWVNMRAYNCLVCGPIGDEMQLIKYFSDYRYVDPFRRYSRSNSKVVKNRAEFWTFLPSQILLGAHLAKLGGSKLTVLLYGYWTKVHRTCLAERGRNCSRSHIFPLLISCIVPEIFAIKVGSCVKSVQILHVFGPPNLLGEAPNFWTRII